MTALKLRKIGNSVGVVLPAEALAQMEAGLGDTVYLTKTVGGVRLTPYDPDFEKQMKVARKVMRKRRNLLRELAK
ncbi:MAG: AbrB/MazE/SpoVT family DNA-binding domain-containing protein [Methylovirgula sp.]